MTEEQTALAELDENLLALIAGGRGAAIDPNG